MLAKLVIFSILFFLSSGISFAQSPDSPDPFLKSDSPEFWDDLRIIPVQFLEKTEKTGGNVQLSAIFASKFVVERIEFLLLNNKNPENEAVFFEQDGEVWEEKVDRKTFLKKLKKDYWLTTYLKTERENIIVSAHHFKSWQSVKNTFASNPDLLRRNADNVDFWEDMRMSLLHFYQIKENKVYWMLFDLISPDEPISKKDLEIVILPNNTSVYRRFKGVSQMTDFRLIEDGVLTLQSNTVFHRQEFENSKPKKMLKFTIVEGRLRLKPVLLEKEYFLANYQKHFWICFYDSQYQSLVRVIQAPESLPVENKR